MCKVSIFTHFYAFMNCFIIEYLRWMSSIVYRGRKEKFNSNVFVEWAMRSISGDDLNEIISDNFINSGINNLLLLFKRLCLSSLAFPSIEIKVLWLSGTLKTRHSERRLSHLCLVYKEMFWDVVPLMSHRSSKMNKLIVVSIYYRTYTTFCNSCYNVVFAQRLRWLQLHFWLVTSKFVEVPIFFSLYSW